MIKYFFRSFILLFSISLLAQEGSSSPYSYYGLGDMRFKGPVENRAMGGLSIITDSIHFNLQNPASYSALKLTTFTVGAGYNNTKLSTEAQEEKARRTTLDYLAIAWPMGRWGAGFGVMPYTSVGYKIEDPAPAGELSRQYSGTGGINRVFFGTGYELTKGLYAGVDFNYFFGNIETSSIYAIEQVLQLGTREVNTSAASGVGMTAGLSYRRKVGEKLHMYAASTFSPASTITLSNDRTIGTVQFTINGIRPFDEVNVPVADSKVKIPAKFSLGSGIGEDRKWMAGAEITMNHNSSLRNRFGDVDGVSFENAVRYNIGGYYIPKFNSFSNYLERIVYRAGFFYQNTGLVINNQQINDMAGTIGLGFPLGGAVSNINAAFEYGKRGTTDAGLIQEKYFNVTLALSLNDRWFVKRRYD